MYCPACGYDKNPPGADKCANCELSLAHLSVPAPNGPVETSLMNDPVSVLDPRPPLTVPADATLGAAIRCMITDRVGAVLVTGTSGELVGILTERDFLTKIAGAPGFEALPVTEFMTPSPETVAPADVLAFALGKMDAGGYRHLPVVDAGRPVGVISVRDILRHLTAFCADG
ncbi:CBS domain containing protein OS=uncultured Acidobacteria bacterium GN=HGMM_F54F02C36 PE=4 SV=1: CBS: CBS [Gemmata massiliana]|uniref:CBS domain-containing protein n=1 Tax=Gemmata massiliana TaxID=1210884 RepID=A0A6P2CU26_9BACT|nr:CBS domain-containing protein [Gemmata massiliana]VTR91194.1 CBS domain containing protein OS=uncultured Acidobacteria bacterium GN=HGMM_F54F02C36 PE=4 SV=1: CBS: CBS [Gemmata massiliana]